MLDWNSQQYLKFATERTQPALDLAARISVEQPSHIMDVGCGPGNSTQVLSQRWPQAHIAGFDSSPDMLNQAKSSYPKGNWFQSTVEDWQPSHQYDIIFSNAVLQWVAHHDQQLPKLISHLNPHGALAIQMPAHYKSPLHQHIVQAAQMPQWREFTAEAIACLSLHEPAFYFNLLAPITSRLDIWETQYFHQLANTQAIIDWFMSTGLRPYLAAIPSSALRTAFIQEVYARCEKAYPPMHNGQVLFPFNRFFMIAYK